jgi:hypothetical protein
MRLWGIQGDGESGWIAARLAHEAASIWAENASDECDKLEIEAVEIGEVGGMIVIDDAGEPAETLGEAFAACVKSGKASYLAGSIA